MAKKSGGTTDNQEGTATRRRARGGATRAGKGAGRGRRARGTREAGASGSEAEGLSERARAAGETAAERGRQAAGGARKMAAVAAERGEESMARVVGWVRENPWPTLLIGAGAAWLAVDAVRSKTDIETEMERRRVELDEGVGSMRRSWSRVADAGREAASTVADAGRRSASTVAEAGRGAGEQVGGFVRENPVWAGLAALGIGLAVGLALPATMTENRMLGEARDSAARKARQVADRAGETVREVARGASRITGGQTE